MIKHIDSRARGKDRWSDCEELRLQFLLSATLVHELSHAFWVEEVLVELQ
jgi:hypothetical protein